MNLLPDHKCLECLLPLAEGCHGNNWYRLQNRMRLDLF